MGEGVIVGPTAFRNELMGASVELAGHFEGTISRATQGDEGGGELFEVDRHGRGEGVGQSKEAAPVAVSDPWPKRMSLGPGRLESGNGGPGNNPDALDMNPLDGATGGAFAHIAAGGCGDLLEGFLACHEFAEGGVLAVEE